MQVYKMDRNNPKSKLETIEFKLVVSKWNPKVFSNSCFTIIITNTKKADKKVSTKMLSTYTFKFTTFEVLKFYQSMD